MRGLQHRRDCSQPAPLESLIPGGIEQHCPECDRAALIGDRPEPCELCDEPVLAHQSWMCSNSGDAMAHAACVDGTDP